MDLDREIRAATERYYGMPVANVPYHYTGMKEAIAPYLKRIEELEEDANALRNDVKRFAKETVEERQLRHDMTEEIRRALGISDADSDTFTIDKIEWYKESLQEHANRCAERTRQLSDIERERDSLKMKLDNAEKRADEQNEFLRTLYRAIVTALGYDPDRIFYIEGKPVYLDRQGIDALAKKLVEVCQCGKSAGYLRNRIETALNLRIQTSLNAPYPGLNFPNDVTLCDDMAKALDKLARIERAAR